MKKILSMIVAAAMSMSLVASAFASDFTDVNSKDDNYEAIEVLNTIGLINGVTEDEFDPDGTLTRAQLCAMIVRAVCDEDEIYYNGYNTFTDVKYNHWARMYIETAARQGLMNGFGNGEFKPNDTLTYVQAARVILNALGYGKLDWPMGVNSVAYRLDLYNDIPMIEYDADCTRAHAAQMIYNAFDCEIVREYAGQHFGTDKYFLKDVLGFVKTDDVNKDNGHQYVAYQNIDSEKIFMTDIQLSTEKTIYVWQGEKTNNYYYSMNNDKTEYVNIADDFPVFSDGKKLNLTSAIKSNKVTKATGIFNTKDNLIAIILTPETTTYLPGAEGVSDVVKNDKNYNSFISTVTYWSDSHYEISNKYKTGFVTQITTSHNVTLDSGYTFNKDDSSIDVGDYIMVFFDYKDNAVGYRIFNYASTSQNLG